ncbi:CpaD family pilus assembly protein [Aminobacter sp. Piv2-1]|uniref:CpaD family pilus assembly protein n=1 Tax=Aminobacter sp. Piv2-1 TaxID=3031122 RepID=UPI0030974387
MSQAVFVATRATGQSQAASRFLRPLLAAAAVALVAGCASRDSITVGSIPDDYRTNHPIVIAEKNQTLDIPVGIYDRGISKGQKLTFEGFLDGYDRRNAPPLRILVPAGAANDGAANAAAKALTRVAIVSGVPKNRITISSYQATYADAPSPVRVSYVAMRAQTGRCGSWPEDVLNTAENKHYANFGCSYQNNLAAQIANPADLLGPRKPSEIDAENRSAVIDAYRARKIPGEFVDNSEVNY